MCRHLSSKSAWRDLIALQNDIAREKNRTLIGQTFEVLVEGNSDKDASRLMGRTRTNKLMIFPGDRTTTRRVRSSRRGRMKGSCGAS